MVNAYLHKVFHGLPDALAAKAHLFSTFFMTRLLGSQTYSRSLRETSGQLLDKVHYMNVRRYAAAQ